MQFRVLGPLEVDLPLGEVRIDGAKQRRLLALLLLRSNEVVDVDRLVDGLWGDSVPDGSVHALETAISRLRGSLGPGRIETRPPGYRIRVEHGELDLHSFEVMVRDAARAGDLGDLAGAARLYERAVALWRGPALPELAAGRFPPAEIVRLEEMRLAALEAGLEARLASGNAADVISELEALVAANPFREGARAKLMRALYQAGRQADALRAFKAAREVLVEELGVEPGPELQQLQVAILNQAPDLSPRRTERRLPARSILVVARTGEMIGAATGLAGILGRSTNAEVIVVGLAPSDDQLSRTVAEAASARLSAPTNRVAVRTIGFISRSPALDAIRLADREDVALVLASGDGIVPGGVFDGYLADLLGGSPADVGVVVDRGTHVRLSESTLIGLPFGGRDDDWAALELGVRLASGSGAMLVLVGVPADGRDAATTTRLIADASLLVQRVADVVAQPRLADRDTDGLVRSLADADLVIAGVSGRWRTDGLGPARTSLALRAASPVVFVRRGLRPGLLAPPEGMTAFTWSLAGGPSAG
jgi:DNA-binding SARP family transcriptional activator